MQKIRSLIRNKLDSIYTPSEIKTLTMILCHDVLGIDKIDVYCGKDINLLPKQEGKLISILDRLKENEPIQYVLGKTSFCGYDFSVNQDVLIPRPETEELVNLIVKESNNTKSLLDIGTGSGCIAISLDLKLSEAEVEAWDVSEKALLVAKHNNEQLLANVTFRQQNVLEEIIEKKKYDVIVSNPPYITEDEKEEMEDNVLNYEPSLALFVPNDDPLRFYRRIAIIAQELLVKGGKLYFEINRAYPEEMEKMLLSYKYNNVRVIKDMFDNPRIVVAEK